jgi:dTDP-glucose 4,6-dehydratase
MPLSVPGADPHWSRRTVLVTGAGGFIGSHLAERMASLGARTRAFVRYSSTGSAGWLDRSSLRDEIEVFRGDITDPGSVSKAMDGVDVVFHLAALIGIPYSYDAPRQYVRTNVEGTLNVLQGALAEEVERVVHTSTSEVYGTPRYMPIDEGHPLQGQSPYSATKIAADKLTESFHRSYGLAVVTLRPFNTYGPRQSARAVIPTIITQCLTGGPLRLGNTRPTRDLNFISDTVDGFERAGRASGAVGEVINIGSGTEVSIADLATRIATMMGRDHRIETSPERMRPDDSEVERLCASTEKAARLLGWRSTVPLEEGLRRSIAWFSQHSDAVRSDGYVV